VRVAALPRVAYPGRMRALLVGIAAGTALGLIPVRDESAALVAHAGFQRELRPLIAEHCLGCHAGSEADGGLDLEAWSLAPHAADAARTLRRVHDALEVDLMPPARRPRPDPRS